LFPLLLVLGIGLTTYTRSDTIEGKGMKLTSPAFKHKGLIPSKYTCDGNDISPPLIISEVPSEAKSLVLIVDDPDAPAGTWVHWILVNIDPTPKEIKEKEVPNGALQGMNDFGKQGYGGPCPGSGTHRYQFKLYCLNSSLDMASGFKKSDVEKAMEGKIIEQTLLEGVYKRG
jgi:Raf kinase inhibitor-like YbhB/YbcL family protein